MCAGCGPGSNASCLGASEQHRHGIALLSSIFTPSKGRCLYSTVPFVAFVSWETIRTRNIKHNLWRSLEDLSKGCISLQEVMQKQGSECCVKGKAGQGGWEVTWKTTAGRETDWWLQVSWQRGTSRQVTRAEHSQGTDEKPVFSETIMFGLLFS